MTIRPSRLAALLAPFIAACAALAQTPRIDVGFTRIPPNAGAPSSSAIGISIRLTGDDDGSTLVGTAGEWGGIKSSPEEIHDLLVTDDAGAPCDIAPGDDHGWIIKHPPGAGLTITYQLRPEPRPLLEPGHNDYRPLVRDGLFHAIGNHALVLPQEDPRQAEFHVSWTGFDGWTLASSLGPGADTREITLPIDEFRNSFFIAGDPSIVRLVSRELKGNTVGLALIDADWGFTDDRFLDMVLQVVSADRDFFADHTDPWFLVALTPNGARAGEHGFYFGGTGLLHCFALYCNTGLDLTQGSDQAARIEHLLAHEYFHNWNGGKIRLEAPQGSAYWFSEGFTEYYARKLLRSAGIWTDEQALANLNESLGGYDRNPMRAVPNSRIAADFWNDRDVADMPYRRGDLIALTIDEAIRHQTDGAESLDSLMRELYARAAAGQPAPTPDDLFTMIASRAGNDLAATIRACVEEGQDVPIPETLADGALTLSSGLMRFGDDGFDLGASRAAGKVTGLRPSTGAADAGLHEGQTLVSVERLPPANGPGRLKVVTRQGDGSEHTAIFDAVGALQTVRRYKPAN
ncbi:MAG: hypothetical protein IPJ41_06590 [Phycisphaerales bacterium]|nr:hypothetical protein [Phycisphaerales bacterium]